MSLLKWAQWVQLAEPYSITVTLAFGLPMLISSETGAMAWAGRAVSSPSAAAAWIRPRLCGRLMMANPVRGAEPRVRGGAGQFSKVPPARVRHWRQVRPRGPHQAAGRGGQGPDGRP